MRAPQVVVGWHDFGTTQGAFTAAMTNMALYSGRMLHSIIREVGPYVSYSRNRIVDNFLKTNGDYLLMIDADEEFPPDSLYRSLVVFQNNRADVLFGNYALGDFAPSFYKMDPGIEIPQRILDSELEPCRAYKIDAAATGWLFASREALTRIGEANSADPWRWFNHDLASAKGCYDMEKQLLNDHEQLRLGEDMSFCSRARALGMHIVGYTGILIVHNKTTGILSDFMNEYAKEAGLEIG